MDEKALPKPVDFDQLYPNRFLKAGELGEKKLTLTISAVDIEELEGDKGKKVKGIVSFEKTNKQFVLNRTNGTCIREMFGRKIPEWIGKRITLFAGEWNGEPCVRIWGSPDIDSDRSIEVALPRRKPIRMTMHVVRANGQRAQQQAPQQRVPDVGSMDDEPGASDEP
jgi:hypothetical protein